VPILLKSGLVLLVGGGRHEGSGVLGRTVPQVESTLAFAPETRVTSSTFGASSASFGFDANDPMSNGASTFQCSLDGDPWFACGSPRSYNAVDSGDHVFRVRAQGSLGKTDPTPAVVTKSGKTYPQLVKATSGLIHYWRLGELAGTTAADAQDPSTPGAYAGTFQLGQGGAFFDDKDRSVAFDGAGSVRVPSAGSFTSFTIEGWTRLSQAAPTSINGNNTLFGQWGSVRLIARPGGVYADEFVNGERTATIQAGTQGNVGEWVHWALVRDGARMTVYRDGQRVVETTSVPPAPTAVSGLIGAEGPIGSETYRLHGRVDDVAIYNRALTQSELHGHYVHFAP
jgi:Concanavalin A-like lectin/glucanases superfamily